MSTARIKKIMLISIGSLSLALGFLGAFLPVLPTTPFLLLAAYCYLHGSKRLYRWLINHPLLGAYIYNYLTYRAITRSTRYGALFFLWLTLIISMVVTANLQLSILLTAVGVGVTIHLLMLNTLDRDEFNRLVLVRKGQKELIR